MQWLAVFQQDIIRDVDYVVDRTDTAVHQFILQPKRTFRNFYVFDHLDMIGRRIVRVLNGNFDVLRNRTCFFRNRSLREFQCFVVDGCNFIGGSAHA